MQTIVFDVLTPNHDGPDGSYTRLLIVPLKPELQELARGLAGALEQGGDLIDTLTSTRRHAYLIRPSLATNPKLQQHLDAITQRVHATGIANFATPILSMEELASLRDKTGAVAGITITRAEDGPPWLHWKGYIGDANDLPLAWQTTRINTQTLLEGAAA